MKKLFLPLLLALASFAHAETSTTRLGLIKPAHGEYFGTWETVINGNADIIDSSACIQGAANTFTGGNSFTGAVTFPNLTANQCLTLDGSKIVTSQACITPPGNDTNVMYNQGGTIAGSDNFTFNGTTISVSGAVLSSATLRRITWSDGTVQVSSPAAGAAGAAGADGSSIYPATATANFSSYGLLSSTIAASTVAVNSVTDRTGTTIIRTDGGNYLTISSVTFADGTVLTSTAGLAATGGGGYALQPATVTIQANKGITVSSLTVTSTFTVTTDSITLGTSSSLISMPTLGAGPNYVKVGAGGTILTAGPILGADIPGGTTGYIRSTSTLQSGATFYVSSGTANIFYSPMIVASTVTASSVTITNLSVSTITASSSTITKLSVTTVTWADGSTSTTTATGMSASATYYLNIPSTGTWGADKGVSASTITVSTLTVSKMITVDPSFTNQVWTVNGIDLGQAFNGIKAKYLHLGAGITQAEIHDTTGLGLDLYDDIYSNTKYLNLQSTYTAVGEDALGGIVLGKGNLILKSESYISAPTAPAWIYLEPSGTPIPTVNLADGAAMQMSTMSASQFVVTDASKYLRSYDLLNSTHTWTGANTFTSSQTFQNNVTISSGVYFTTNSIAGFDEYQSSAAYVSISTINWTQGNKQAMTLTANTAFNFVGPNQSGSLILRISAGAGSYAATWPANVLWSGGTAPTITVTASKQDIVACYYSKQANTFFCTATQNF